MTFTKRGRRALAILFLILASALVALASCGAPSASFMSLVPQESFLVGYAQDPAALLANTDEFIKAIGMDAVLGGSSAEDLAFGQLGIMGIEAEEVKPLLDLSRPSGFYASGESLKDMEPIILLAVKSEAKARAWISENLGDSLRVVGGKGYIALSPSGKEFSWPPEKALAPGLIQEKGTDRLVVALDYGRLMDDPMMDEVMEEASGEMEALAPMMEDLIASMGWMSFQLGLDGKVLALGSTMAFDPSTDYGKLIASVKYGKAGMADELSTDEVMGWAANAELGDMEAYMAYLKASLSLFKLDVSSLKAPLTALVKASGSDGFFSVDINPDSALSQREGIGVIQGLGLKMRGKASVKDEAAFRPALDGFLAALSTLATEAVKAAVLASEGPGALEKGPAFSLGFESQKDQKGSGLSWDSHRLSLSVEGLEEDKVEQLAALSELFEMKVSYGKGLALIAAGADSEASLNALAAGSKPASPLSAAEGYAEVAAALGKDQSMIFHLSLARLINKLAPLAGVPMEVEENVPGFLMAAGMGKDLYSMDMALSAPEIKSYIGQAFPLVMQIFSQRKSLDYDDGYGDYGDYGDYGYEEGNEGFDYDALQEYEDAYGDGYIIPEYPDDAGYGE